jgi:6-phosphogluconate dehydrogenase
MVSFLPNTKQKNTFLVQIGANICEKKDKEGHHVLSDVQDKVVQDISGEEGTGIWSNTQATSLHVPAPTLSTAHYLRIASAYRGQRKHVQETFHGAFLPSPISLTDEAEKVEVIEDLRRAVYTTCLASFVQGISIIDVANAENKWSISFPSIIQIWRSGCIIASDHISSLLHSIFHSPDTQHKNHNLLFEPLIVAELKAGFEPLKRLVRRGVDCNAVVPSMSATLEWLKYSGNLELPTQFYEAELDYFGKHMYDSKRLDEARDKEGVDPQTGKRHFEWKSA